MAIGITLKRLHNIISFLFINANISDIEFRIKIYLCPILPFKRFYTDNKLQEMTNMLKTKPTNPKIIRILEKYGPGFDEIYYNGYEDGIILSSKKIARKCLEAGMDINIISRSTGISIEELEKIKRTL